MTDILHFLLSVLLLSASPQVRYSKDRREFDGERYTEYCVGLFQRAETWACIEVPR